MHRRVFLPRLGGAGALLAGMSLLEACSPATPASQPPASSTAPATASGPRGQMIVAQGGDVVSMDPHKINDMISMSVAATIKNSVANSPLNAFITGFTNVVEPTGICGLH